MYKAVLNPRNDQVLIKAPAIPEVKAGIVLTEKQKEERGKEFIKTIAGPIQVVSVGPDIKDLEPNDTVLLRENTFPAYFPNIECEEGFNYALVSNYQVVAKVIVLD